MSVNIIYTPPSAAKYQVYVQLGHRFLTRPQTKRRNWFSYDWVPTDTQLLERLGYRGTSNDGWHGADGSYEVHHAVYTFDTLEHAEEFKRYVESFESGRVPWSGELKAMAEDRP